MDTVYVDSDLSNDSYGFQSKAERHVIGDFGSVNDAIDQFMSIANVADVASLYRNRPVWANSPVPSLVNPAAKVFAQFPCARCAVLHYIGLLTHEATHIYFSQKENPHFVSDCSSIEKAVHKLTGEVRRFLDSSLSKSVIVDVLNWTCSLFAEICQQNAGRPILAKSPNVSSCILPLFESCPAINYIIKLSDKATGYLLESNPDECLEIFLQASKQGIYFDWFWLHVASSFPSSFVPQLLKIGVAEFKEYVLETCLRKKQGSVIPASFHEEYQRKFRSLSEIFSSLASKRNADLRSSTRSMLVKSFEQLEDTEQATLGENSDLTIPFLFKLITCSPDVLRFLIQQTFDLITSSSIVCAVKQLSLIGKENFLPNMEYTAFLRQMIFFLHPDAINHILEMALPIAFDERIFERFSRESLPLRNAMKEGANVLVNEILGLIVASVHNSASFTVGDYDILRRCACDPQKLNECIIGSLSGGQRAKFYIRFLHAFCIASGPVKTAEVIARFIIEAEDEHQLKSLCALMTTLVALYPDLGRYSIEHFSSNREIICTENRKQKEIEDRTLFCGERKSEDTVDLRWLENLSTLNQWETESAEKSPLKYMGFMMSSFYGELMVVALSYVLDELDKITNSGSELSEKKIATRNTIVQTLITFISSIGPPSLIVPSYAHKMSAQFASLLATLLLYIDEGKHSSEVSQFLGVCASATEFLASQLGYVREVFVMHLLDEVLARASELFGHNSINVWEMEEQFARGCEIKDILSESAAQSSSARQSNRSPLSVSLLEEVREMPLKSPKAVRMAHSGIIGKGARKPLVKKFSKSHCLRFLVFFECFQRFCSTPGEDEIMIPIPTVYKQVAITITNEICRDGLTASYLWEEWEVEKESVSRYLAASNRLSGDPFLWSILLAVADVRPCLWFCLPLLKAILASVMIQFENTCDKKSLPTGDLIDLLDRWFLLAKKGSVLPLRMTPLFDIISKVTVHEGFILLLEIWRYFHVVSIDLNVGTMFERSLTSPPEAVEGDLSGILSLCCLVIQRNIEKLGFLVPIIFADQLAVGTQ